MNTKQRAMLRSMANTIEPVVHIGKDGVNDNLVKQTWDALEARELIKLTVLENCTETPREAADAIAEAVGADVVGVIGRKIILYRESVNHKTIEL